MTILWCGGEEIDFPTRVSGVVNNTTANYRRTAYSRAAVLLTGGVSAGDLIAASTALTSAITSGWMSAQVYASTSLNTSRRLFGFGRSGGLGGLCMGFGSASSKVGLFIIDSTGAATLLASESGTSFSAGAVHRVDMQVAGFGTGSGTVNVYFDGNLLIAYSGSLTTSGLSDLDNASGWYVGSGTFAVSECILANEDTRLFSLATLAPSAAGDANAWTGAYTDVDEAVLSDADTIYTDTDGNDFQCNLTNTPTGNFVVKAVKVLARASKSASGITSIKLGIKTGGTIDVGSAIALDTAWAEHERLMPQNPVTANNWTISEADALQIDLRAAT